MKKLKKMMISLLALGVFFGFVLSVSASIADGNLGGKDVIGRSEISASDGAAQTIISVEPTHANTRVDLTYQYVDESTGRLITETKVEFGRNNADAELKKPSGSRYRSYRTQASHRASYAGQTWTSNTSIYN